MPSKSGGSHALGAFVTLILGTLLTNYLWAYAPPLGQASLFVLRVIQRLTGVAIPDEHRFAGTLILMVGLSFLWGVGYHVARHGE